MTTDSEIPEEKKPEEGKPQAETPKEETPEANIQAVDPQLLQIINYAMGKIQGNFNDAIKSVKESLHQEINTIRAQTSESLKGAPDLIRETVEVQLQGHIKGIIQEISSQFEEKFKQYTGAGGGGGGGGGGGNGAGLSLNQILANSDKIIGVINAFRSPTTEQAMMSQMSNVLKWHKVFSSIEKGGGNVDDLTTNIASTFATDKQQKQESPGG
jgi:hypothetical protein